MQTHYEDFLAAQAKEDYPPAPEQLSALRTLFSDSSIPISQVAKEFASPTIKELENSSEVPGCSIIWRLMHSAIEEFTDYNNQFVELIVELQKLPDGNGFFASLPEFRNHWTEFVCYYTDPPSTDPSRSAKRQAWININAFNAKLSALALAHNVSSYDERARGGMELVQVLEITPWDTPNQEEPVVEEDPEDEDPEDRANRLKERAHELELQDVRVLNGMIPAVAQWVKWCGKGLYKMEGEIPGYFGDTIWKGKNGWSKERFAFWRGRFEWVENVAALDTATKRAAKEAKEAMVSIEQGA